MAATLIAYVPAMRGGWIWDDDDYVTENPTLNDVAGLRRIWFKLGAVPQYYPLTHTTFWLERRLWGLNPAGYHIINVLFHSANALLLWQILRRLRLGGAWAIAMVFALHPAHVESVAWITERKNVLSGFFYLLAALSYLRFIPWRDREASALPSSTYVLKLLARLSAPLLLFAAALLSKTTASSLPAAILLVIWWQRGRIGWREFWPLIPFFLLAVPMGMLTSWMERTRVGAVGPEWDFSLIERILIAGRAFWFYPQKLLWPADLTFVYERWRIDSAQVWQYVYPLTAAAAILVLWIARRRIGRGPLVAVLFYAGTIFPALGFVNVYPMRYSFVADHFQYLASIGIMVLVIECARALFIFAFPRSERKSAGVRVAAMAIVLAILGTLTWHQGKIYAGPETLWQDTREKNPSAWIAWNNLGDLLLRRGDFRLAEQHFQQSLRLNPQNVESHFNLGLIADRRGDGDRAMAHYQQAVELSRREGRPHIRSYILLGALLMERGETERAAEIWFQAQRLDPQNPDLANNVGMVLAAQQRWTEAVEQFRLALSRRPDFVEAHTNLGVALLKLGPRQEAIEHLEEALRLRPDYDLARRHLEAARQQ